MKKILSLLLVVLMMISVVVSIYFIKADGSYKLGLGVYSTYKSTSDVTDKENGKGSYVTTAAAVLLDDSGRVIKCEIDTAEVEGEFTADGKFVSKTEFSTKGELKESYGMSNYGKTEWYKQADAFETQVVGKTAQDIASLMADDGRGNANVISAGCTIYVTDFIKAVSAAINNAKASDASSDDTLKLAVITSLSGTDATDKDAGTLEFETTFAAVTLDTDSTKITACTNDCLAVAFSFDKAGKIIGEYVGEIKSKRTLKEDYGMSNYGKTEWYKQADAFDAACVGKTSAQVAGLMGDDYKGIEAVQNAGCTIYVSGMVNVITKAAK